MGLDSSANNPLPDAPNQPASDNLTRLIIAVAIALGLLTVCGLFAFGGLGFRETRQLAALPWVQPAAQSLIMLSSFALAILFLGRNRALGSVWAFWSGRRSDLLFYVAEPR